MNMTRRSILAAGATAGAMMGAGCSGKEIEVVEVDTDQSLSGSATFDILVRVDGGPFEARALVTLYDGDNDVVEELVTTTTLEDGQQMITVEGDVPSSTEHYEATVEET